MHKFFAKTQFLGKKVIFLPQCHSTNEEAQLLLKESDIEGTTIITQNQTKGKGQRGNSWESQPGKNATFSVVLKPVHVSPNQQFSLHLIVSLAVHDALYLLLGKKLKIKWPNDIYYADQKLGGILIENSLRSNQIESSVIGIGINVNQVDFTLTNATSLKEITGNDFAINEVIEQILIALENRYLSLRNMQYDVLKSDYLARLFRHHELHTFENSSGNFQGKIVGISNIGLLQIESSGQLHEYNFQEVSFII